MHEFVECGVDAIINSFIYDAMCYCPGFSPSQSVMHTVLSLLIGEPTYYLCTMLSRDYGVSCYTAA